MGKKIRRKPFVVISSSYVLLTAYNFETAFISISFCYEKCLRPFFFLKFLPFCNLVCDFERSSV